MPNEDQRLDRAKKARTVIGDARSRIKLVLEIAKGMKDDRVLPLTANRILVALNGIESMLTDSMPFASCPECRGDGSPKCPTCLGSGHVSKDQYNGFSPGVKDRCVTVR